MSNRGQKHPLPEETQAVTIWILDILETHLFDGRDPYERFVDDDGEPRFQYVEQETDDLRTALVGVLRSYLDPVATCSSLDSGERVTRIMGGSFKYSRWIPDLFVPNPVVPAPPTVEDSSDNLSEVLLVSFEDDSSYEKSRVEQRALENATYNKVNSPWNVPKSMPDQTGDTCRTSTVVDRDNQIHYSSPVQSIESGVTEPLTTIFVSPNQETITTETVYGAQPEDFPSGSKGSTTSDITEPSSIASLASHQNSADTEASDLIEQDDSTNLAPRPSEPAIPDDTETLISSFDTSIQDTPSNSHSAIIGRNNSPHSGGISQDSPMLDVQKTSIAVTPTEMSPDPPTILSGAAEMPSTIPPSKTSHIKSRKRRRKLDSQDTSISSDETGRNNPLAVNLPSIPGFIGKRADVASAVTLTLEAIELFRSTPTEIREFVEKLLIVEEHGTGLQALCTKILDSVDPRKPLMLRTNNASKRYMQMAIRFVVFAKLAQRKPRTSEKALPNCRSPISETVVGRRSSILRNYLLKSPGRDSSAKDNGGTADPHEFYEKVESIEIWASLLYQFGWAGALFFNWMIGLGTLGGYDPIQLGGWLKGQVKERLGTDALELFSVNEVPDLNVIIRILKGLESQKPK